MPLFPPLKLSRLFQTCLLGALLVFFGCTSEADTPQEDPQQAFLDNYAEYCGYAYAGQTVMVDLGDDSEFEGADLRMILEACDGEVQHIPFYVNDDTSRTWIVQMTENGLHLSHDHRHPDGSEYEANMYGGYADDQGTTTKQFFPADERTIEERPAREINVWSKEFDFENERYYYRLYLRDELRYEAAFDLSEPISLGEAR